MSDWLHSPEEWDGVLKTVIEDGKGEIFSSDGSELTYITTRLKQSGKDFSVVPEIKGFKKVVVRGEVA